MLKQTNFRYDGEILVNPEIARGLLENNHVNRKVSQPYVRRYAKDMATGNWQNLPESMTLSFSENGNLLDGQHRLNALIKANIEMTFQKVTIIGVNEAGECMFDQGKKRHDFDFISIPDSQMKLWNTLLRFTYGSEHKEMTLPQKLDLIQSTKNETKDLFFRLNSASACRNPSMVIGALIYMIENPLTDEEIICEILRDTQRKEYRTPIGIALASHRLQPACINWESSCGSSCKKSGPDYAFEIYLVFRNDVSNYGNYKKFEKREFEYKKIRQELKTALGWE